MDVAADRLGGDARLRERRSRVVRGKAERLLDHLRHERGPLRQRVIRLCHGHSCWSVMTHVAMPAASLWTEAVSWVSPSSSPRGKDTLPGSRRGGDAEPAP